MEMIREWLEGYSVINMYINFRRHNCDGVSLVMVSLQNIETPFFSLKAYGFKLCNVVIRGAEEEHKQTKDCD